MVKDPVLREFAIQAGGGSFFANFTGNPAVLGNKFYNYNGLGLGQGQMGFYTQGQLTGGEVSHPEAGNYQQMTSAPMLPNYLGIPFRILVSPFINVNPETRTTDVLMFNSKNLGALIVQEDPHLKSWEDGQYNMNHMSIEETYGFGILNEGQAIAIAKNVKIRPNEFTMPARSVFNLSEANSTYTRPGLSVMGVNKTLTRARGSEQSALKLLPGRFPVLLHPERSRNTSQSAFRNMLVFDSNRDKNTTPEIRTRRGGESIFPT